MSIEGAATLFLEVNTGNATETLKRLKGALDSVGATPVKTDTDEATKKIVVLETEVSKLGKQLSTLNTKSLTDNQTITTLTQQVRVLSAEADRLGVKLTSLGTSSIARNNSVEQLTGQYSALSPAVAKATHATAQFTDAQIASHSALRGVSGALGALWLTYGQLGPLLAGAALGAGFKRAAKDGAEFAYQLTFVKTLGGESAESIAKISSAALELSKTGLFGPVELANGLRILSQAGLTAKESIEALPTTMALATVGEMAMEAAALTLVGVMNAFGKSLSALPHIGDMFAKAAALSQTSVAGMTEAMKQASVVHEQYGASIEDTATALTLLAKVNITGTRAGTSYRNMLKDLYTPSAEAAKVMKQLGVETKDAAGNLKDAPAIIYDLQAKLKQFTQGSQTDILGKIFSERGGKEAIAMLGITKDRWNDLKDAISNSDGFMEKVTAELEQTVKGRFQQALNTMNSNIIKAFEDSEGSVRGLANALLNLADSPAFISGINAIVGGVATLATTVVNVIPTLVRFGEAWLVFKGIGLAVGGIEAASKAVKGLGIAMAIVGAESALAGGGLVGLRAGLAATTSAAGVAAGAAGLGGFGAALALLANPITWVVTGLGAIAYAFKKLVLDVPASVDAFKDFNDVLERQNKKLADSNRLLEGRNEKMRAERLNGPTQELDPLQAQRAKLQGEIDKQQAKLNSPGSNIFDQTQATNHLSALLAEKKRLDDNYNQSVVEGAKGRYAKLGQVTEQAEKEIARLRADFSHEGVQLDTSQLEAMVAAWKRPFLSLSDTELEGLNEQFTRVFNSKRQELTTGGGTKTFSTDKPDKSALKDAAKAELTKMREAIKLAKQEYETIAAELDTKFENFSITKTEALAQKYTAQILSLQKQAEEVKKEIAFAKANGKQADLAAAEGELKVIQEKINSETNTYIAAQIKNQQALLKETAEYTLAKQTENDTLEFQLDLIGKSTLEIELLTDARRRDLEVAQKANNYTVENGVLVPRRKENADQIEAVAAAEKQRSQDLIKQTYDAQRSFETGWSNAYNAYVEDATNAATLARDVFATSTGAMTDMISRFITTGKASFKDLKETVLKLLSDLAARMALFSFGSLLGGTGSASAATSAAGAGVAGTAGSLGSIGSLANAGSSVFQLGGGLANGFLAGMSSAGSEALLGAAFVGPSATLASGSIGAGAQVGSLFGSAASGIATALPWIGGAVALAGLLGAFGKKAAPSKGATATSSLVDGNYALTGLGSGNSDKYDANLAGPAEAINKQYLNTLAPLFEALGSKQALSFTTSLHTRGDGKQYAGFSSTTGDSAVDGMVIGLGKIATSEAIAKATEFAMGEAISQAIVGSDLAEPVRKLFVGVTDTAEVGKLVSGLTTLATESDKLNEVWGVSVTQAASIAVATSDAGLALTEMAGVMTSLKSQGEVAAATYVKLTDAFSSLSDASYPTDLKEYDAAMKGVNTTTQEGIATFTALLGMRGDFATFTAAINQAKQGVNDAVFDLRSTSEQAAINQSTLADAAKAAGVQVPATAAELVKMADAIDYTKQAGVDLALALPGLVAAFKATEASATTAAGAARKAEVEGRRASQQAQAEALTTASVAAKEAADTLFASIKDGLARVDAWLKSSILGSASALSPEQKIAEAQQQFNDTYQRAQGGDSEAISHLTEAADALQTAARDGLASSPAYIAIWSDIRAKLGSFGDGSQFTVAGRAEIANQQSLADQDAWYQNMLKDYRYEALQSWSDLALSAGYSASQVSMINGNAWHQGNVTNGGGNQVDWEGSLVDPAKFDALYSQIRSDNIFTKKSLVDEDEATLRRVVNSVIGVIPTEAIVRSLEANGQASTGGLLDVINELRTLNNSTDTMVANNRLGVVA